MKTLILVLLVVWLVLSVLGALIEGLMWLLMVGLILFAVTAAYGWLTRGRGANRT
ncbi:hypothetical protein [Cellulomonas phragmiteti]|nr:hypothetical protein [Cellulomonas phragmiteti]